MNIDDINPDETVVVSRRYLNKLQECLAEKDNYFALYEVEKTYHTRTAERLSCYIDVAEKLVDYRDQLKDELNELKNKYERLVSFKDSLLGENEYVSNERDKVQNELDELKKALQTLSE